MVNARQSLRQDERVFVWERWNGRGEEYGLPLQCCELIDCGALFPLCCTGNGDLGNAVLPIGEPFGIAFRATVETVLSRTIVEPDGYGYWIGKGAVWTIGYGIHYRTAFRTVPTMNAAMVRRIHTEMMTDMGASLIEGIGDGRLIRR